MEKTQDGGRRAKEIFERPDQHADLESAAKSTQEFPSHRLRPNGMSLAHAATPGIKPHRSINLKMVRPRHWACEDDEVNNRLDKSIIVLT